MNSRFILLALLTFPILTGCAPKHMLVKDVSNEQLGKDNGECKLEAQKATQFDLSGSVILQTQRQNQAIENCLQAKGYAYQQELNEQQKAIDVRYNQAGLIQNKKLELLSEYIVNVCRPKEDKEYINCTHEKHDEFIAASVFHDLTIKMYNEQKEFEQQLIRKEITRKEYRENVDKISNDMISKVKERVQSDIKSGIYTGKY